MVLILCCLVLKCTMLLYVMLFRINAKFASHDEVQGKFIQKNVIKQNVLINSC